MNAWAFKSNDPSEAEKILTRHGDALPLLAAGPDAEFFIYTQNMENKLMYLSDSAFAICQIRANSWTQTEEQRNLAESPLNFLLHLPVAGLKPNQLQRVRCEVVGDDGVPIMIEVARRWVMLDDAPIGVVGYCKRCSDHVGSEKSNQSALPENIRRRIDSLSLHECEVIELVVKGEMNKSIAKKLGIAVRTVESRRSKAMKKLAIQSLPDLVRLWITKDCSAKSGFNS